MNETSWKILLSQIREGNVVPVIGSRLLVSGDGQQSLQLLIAERLLEMHNIQVDPESLPPFREVNDVVSRLKAVTNLQDLYANIHEAIQELTSNDAAIPGPILQLAQISDFHLFVTLTPDDMLARCLKRRYIVNEIIHSPKLPSSEARDLSVDWHGRAGEAHLLYLFGKSRSSPMFAIHDEDLLEYAHNIITRGSNVPNRFLNELQERNLLFIGCNFPDWLTRFFLRVTRKNRLAEQPKREWLIDELQPQESLTCFLNSFCKDTEILSQIPPVNFVEELNRRWKAGAPPPPPPPTHRVMFFISYSRCTDYSRAETMVKALQNLGVPENQIWFDRNIIEPGDNFRLRIIDGIRTCRYFLPLLSLSANRREQAFVFREWGEANKRLEEMNYEFIIPVVVDADFEPRRYTAKPVRAWADIDFGFAPEGVPNNSLTTKLSNLLSVERQREEG
jgi:hypothetical protein